jgi:hypothetical protein
MQPPAKLATKDRLKKAEVRRQRAFMFRSDGDSTPSEREPLNLRSVGVLNPCSLRSRAAMQLC